MTKSTAARTPRTPANRKRNPVAKVLRYTRTDRKPMKTATAGAYVFATDGTPLSRGYGNPGLDEGNSRKV